MTAAPHPDTSPMGRRRRWLVHCHGKEPFESLAIANTVNRRRNTRGSNGNVYKCATCGAYHIGGQEWAIRRKGLRQWT